MSKRAKLESKICGAIPGLLRPKDERIPNRPEDVLKVNADEDGVGG